MVKGESHDLAYFDYSDYAPNHSSGVCGQLGNLLMFDQHYILRAYYRLICRRVLELIEKVYLDTDKEELEFNGRWADDGGRNVE